MTVGRNANRQDYPLDAGVGNLVSRQCEQSPGALAVLHGERTLTYLELNARANQLAHHLQALGVRPDTLVSCCLSRSPELVVALLAVLKAGAAYVPMDPGYPPDRLDFMVRDAQAPIVISQRSDMAGLSSHNSRLLLLDEEADAISGQSTLDPVETAATERLAYVIYTSGSTGRPKGVEVTERSLLNLIYWHQRAFSITESDRASQMTSPAFDATGWELWPYLTRGAGVDIVDDAIRSAPADLRDWLVNRGITVTFLPTHIAEMVMTLDWTRAGSVRLLLTGADTLHRFPPSTLPFKLVNNYGPTEATVVATSAEISPAERPDGAPSIGRPIANTEIHILNERLGEVPPGTPGEIFIGGEGVARGYLRQPGLTAERFIPNPYSSEPGARLYRTGDRGSLLPDGQVRFLGRNDSQIKVRGYRIEADEVISAIDEHPAVQASVVIGRENGHGDHDLVAYVVPASGAELQAGSLRARIAGRLPNYMIPSVFVVLDALPISPNGKIERDRLPVPEPSNILGEEGIDEPSTILEQRLAAIVAPLLGREEVGVDDNFFLIGGHSMMGAQLIVRAAEAFAVNISLRSLFENPTVRQLARHVEDLIVDKLNVVADEDAAHLYDDRLLGGKSVDYV